VILQIQIGEEKSKHVILAQQNCFDPVFLQSLLRLSKGTPKLYTLPEKSVIIMIFMLLPVYDWPIIMISPNGLLVVASHVFVVSVLVLGAGSLSFCM
jgi:hypothetical protein